MPHKGAAVEAYFDNLLPDSEPIRRRLQDRFHTASRGAFDLLPPSAAIALAPSNYFRPMKRRRTFAKSKHIR